MKYSRGILAVIALSVVILAACNPAPAATSTPAPAPPLSIEGAYGHASPSMPTTGGLFMVIKNAGLAADKLVSGKSDACGSVEIHEMVKKADGTMGMNLVTDPLEVPAGGQLELKEGSYHMGASLKLRGNWT
jgi:periplasmic copper chaperone A